MKFSICNELFEGWDFADICRTAKELGYDGVEIAPFTFGEHPCELTSAQRQELVGHAAVSSIEIVGLHWLLAGTQGLHVSHPDMSVRNRTANYLADLARLCSDVGGRIMVFGSPNQRNVLEDVTQDQAREYAMDTFGKAVPTLEQLGVVLCLEPLTPQETNFLNTAASAAEMIRELDSPSIRLILDVKAMSSEDAATADIIRANAALLSHVHANDANKRGPGFGNTDFAPIAAALRDIHYDGWVSVEVFDFKPDPITIARQSMGYLRETFAIQKEHYR